MPSLLIDLSLILFKIWFGFAILYLCLKIVGGTTNINIILFLFISIFAYVGFFIMFSQSLELLEIFGDRLQ